MLERADDRPRPRDRTRGWALSAGDPGCDLELLLDDGDVGRADRGAVAARSGVAKTTIYRRWRDKWQLALDAVMIDMLPRLRRARRRRRHPQGSCSRSSTRSSRYWAATPYGPAMQGLASQIATDPASRPRLPRAGRRAPPRPSSHQSSQRGIARGDLRPDTDIRLIHELLVGPILYRLAARRRPTQPHPRPPPRRRHPRRIRTAHR